MAHSKTNTPKTKKENNTQLNKKQPQRIKKIQTNKIQKNNNKKQKNQTQKNSIRLQNKNKKKNKIKMVFEPTDQTDFIYDQIRTIMNSINEDKYLNMLNETALLLQILDQNFKKQHKLTKIEKTINNILQDDTRIRILKLLQRIKNETDTAIEYYDKDIGQDERLYYQEEFEKDMIEIQAQIRKTLATIIKEKLSGQLEL